MHTIPWFLKISVRFLTRDFLTCVKMTCFLVLSASCLLPSFLVCMSVCLGISIPPENISFIWSRHRCHWKTVKYWPVIGTTFEFGRISITSHLQWLGPSVCPLSSEGLPKYSPLLRQARATEDLFYPDLNETRNLMVTPIDIHYIIDHSYMMTCLT